MPEIPVPLKYVERYPVEDVLLDILRQSLPDIKVMSLIEEAHPVPSIVVRRDPVYSALGFSRDEALWLDSAIVLLQVFTDGPDADSKAARISEAVRVALRNAMRTQMRSSDGSYLAYFALMSQPRRATDWATATGPVQYADLPSGMYRYEMRVDVDIRVPPSRVNLPHH